MPVSNRIDYVLRDASGGRAKTGFWVEPGLTLAQYQQGGQALAQEINAITNGVVESASMTIPVDVSGLTQNIAGANSDVEEVARFGATTADGRPVQVNVPGLIPTAIAAGSDDLNQANSAVAAMISMLEDGIVVTGGTIRPSDVGEQDITQVLTARYAVRPSGTRR